MGELDQYVVNLRILNPSPLPRQWGEVQAYRQKHQL